MELRYGLESNDSIHIWCLRAIWLPRINDRLQLWTTCWNNHEIAGHSSPEDIFELERWNSNDTNVHDVYNGPDFGIDWNGPIPNEDDRVQLPLDDIEPALANVMIERFSDRIDAQRDDPIELWREMVNAMYQLHEEMFPDANNN